MKEPRPYRQQARAAKTEARRAALLDAVEEVFLPRPGGLFSLEEVAERAGTSVQTLLRHFQSKAGLIEAAAARRLAETQAGRDEVPVGDLPAVAAYLADHYESTGPMMLRLLAVEHDVPAVAEIVASGRDLHRTWVRRVLAPHLAGRPARERRIRLATLVAVTDLLTWKVLRQEQGLSRADYSRSVHDLLLALR